jgi:Fur family transcriptional regulator, ferric uptake regulator
VCTSTVLDEGAKLSPIDRDVICAALRTRGLRLTTQREAVCEAVFNCPGHICAEHILEHAAATYPRLRMNKTTVYRSLDLMMELGLITEHKCGDGRAQYEPASRGDHSHMICRCCGTLFDLEPQLATDFREGLNARYGFRVELESYPILGLCSSCRR